MKDKARKIIRNLLIGAVASIYNTNAQATDISSLSLLEGINDDDKMDAANALKNKVFKNVLQITRSGDTKLIAGHRSHMSHRSSGGGGGHYSHSSHSSHYSSSGSRSRSYSSPSSVGSSSYGTNYPTQKNYSNYNLGDRTLKTGLYGNDVSELTDLLISKNYMNNSWITNLKGYPAFSSKVADAVRRFQKDAGLPQDGIVTPSLVSKLKGWDKNNTTLVLGVRDLVYNEASTMFGNDVNELIALLRNAGFPPNPSKLKYKSGKSIYTKDIEMAVKLFQAYNGLTTNGKVEAQTIAKLRAKSK